MHNPSDTDSMMYYFGEMQANNYSQDAESDTLLRSEEAKAQFMEGLRHAIKMDSSDEAYNKGLQLGLRLALRLREFENRYGVSFSKDIMAAALENALNSYKEVDIISAQKGFYAIKDRLELKTASKEVSDAIVKLRTQGNDNGFIMISDTLFAKDVTPGNGGPTFKNGDRVAVEVSASTLDGKEIVARQFPDSLTIGEGRVPKIVSIGINTMTNGQTRTFMTTPRTLFGKRYAAYHLPHDEPVLFTVKAIQN